MNRLAVLLPTLLLLGPVASISAPAAEPSDLRLLSVSGHGEVRAIPDKAEVSLGVVARAPTAAEARAAVNRVVPALLKLAHDLGVPDAQVSSTRLSVNPQYDWDEAQKKQRLTGYSVERQVLVDLRNLDRLGELLEKAVSAGANQVGEASLDSTRRADLQREALAKAVADARLNAGVLATAVGRTVGAPRELAMGAGDGGGPRPMLRSMVAAPMVAEKAAASTYNAGEMTFSADVQAVFDLAPGTASP